MDHAQEHQVCIKNCLDCFKTCTECLIHCLELGGKHSAKSHINLLISCSQICEFHAKLMMRNCKFSSKVAAVCAAACIACAEDCLAIDMNDEMMRSCAEMCQICAKSCQKEASASH